MDILTHAPGAGIARYVDHERFLIDQAAEGDTEAVMQIFLARPGAYREEWRLFPGSVLLVVREDSQIVAFAIVRVLFDEGEVIVDNLECERENGRATLRGVQAMATFGEWLERWVGAHGGGKIISCVGADNQVHERALKKVGYVDRVHILEKRIAAVEGDV